VASAVLAATRFDAPSPAEAVLLGAFVGLVSWGLRRVLVAQRAMTTLRGQVGSGVASVLVTGAIIHTAAVLLT
ncbi:MAG: hypothetical protein JWP82_2902, partial [Humibacillus sp.]|nr:hypothetical protein [Humibacillus sp.]